MTAAAKLGLLGVEASTDGNSEAVIVCKPIAGTTLADRFFIEDPRLGGSLTLEGDIDVLGNSGFVQVRMTGDADLAAGVRIDLKDPSAEADGKTRITLDELLRGLGDIGSIVHTPSLGGAVVSGVTHVFDPADRTITRNDGGEWTGFEAGKSIRIEGTQSNDGIYTILAVADGALTLSSDTTLVDETFDTGQVTQEMGRVDLSVEVEPPIETLVPTTTAERLAKSGLRYNQFHTTALSSPTRAALLTGRNHHTNNTGSIMETSTAFPGNTGQRPRERGAAGDDAAVQRLLDRSFRQESARPPPGRSAPPDRRTAGRCATASTSSTASWAGRRTNGRRPSMTAWSKWRFPGTQATTLQPT